MADCKGANEGKMDSQKSPRRNSQPRSEVVANSIGNCIGRTYFPLEFRCTITRSAQDDVHSVIKGG